jgi:hypothetical protein
MKLVVHIASKCKICAIILPKRSECIHSLAQKSKKVWWHSQHSYIERVQQDPEVSATIQKPVFVFAHPATIFLRYFICCQLVIPLSDVMLITTSNVTGAIFLWFLFVSVGDWQQWTVTDGSSSLWCLCHGRRKQLSSNYASV